MRHKLFYLIYVLPILLTASCGFQEKRENLKNCKFDLDNVSIVSVGLSVIELAVDVGIENPNDNEVILDSMDFVVYAKDKKIAKGKNSEQVEVPGKQRKVAKLLVKTSLADVGMGLLTSLQSGEEAYKVKGIAHIQTWLGKVDVPFEIVPKAEEKPADSLEYDQGY